MTTTSNPQSIGLLGGIFDPPHNGHIAIARRTADALNLSTVIFIPSGTPPHKTHPGADKSHRLAMVELATQSDPRFCVWKGELDRTGISYTVDTLTEISDEYPNCKLMFIIGTDNLSEIPLWKNYRKILETVTLCVVHRPGFVFEIPVQLANATIVGVPSPELDISSTMVRESLNTGKDVSGIMDGKVCEYIRRNSLYV